MKEILEKEGKFFWVVTPTKALSKSTMVHEVINRGDKFAVNLATGELTIVGKPKWETTAKKGDIVDGIYLAKDSNAFHTLLFWNFNDLVVQLEDHKVFSEAKLITIVRGNAKHVLMSNSPRFLSKLKDFCALYFKDDQ
jgi:hypothetical protein